MNMRELLQEYARKAHLLGLQCDCLMAGSTDAELAIIGEAPTPREVQLKTPMVGGAGQKLWETITKYDNAKRFIRSKVYVSNVIKKQVNLATMDNSSKRDPVTTNELEHWKGLFEWELAQLPNLKYVLILGKTAAKTILGIDGIMNWRGSVLEHTIRVGEEQREVTCIITLNPSMVLREPIWEVMFNMDIAKLFLVANNKFKKYEIEYHINPTFDEACSWIDKMVSDNLPVAFDIECMANETICFGMTNDPFSGMCINLQDAHGLRYTDEEEVIIRKKIANLLTNKDVKLVTQNGGFDSYWMGYKDRMPIPHIWFDTLLAHHTLYPRLPHNLGFICTQYTTHPFYKDEGKTWKNKHDMDQFWKYNVKDVCITLYASMKLKKELTDQKMDEFFFNHVMRLQSHLVNMTVTGVKIDTELKEHLKEKFSAEVGECLDAFNKAVCIATGNPDYVVNPKSPKQLKKLYFTDLHLVGYGTSCDEKNRMRMLANHRTTDECKDVLNKHQEFAEKNKFYTTYVESKIDEDGRARCEYKQYGTQAAPGRLSSTSVMWGSGMNLQNQPQAAQPMFIADKGYSLLYYDLKQAEAKVVAYLWNVHGLIDVFERAAKDPSVDVHRSSASKIFKTPYEEIPSFDRYTLGKTTDDPKMDGKITKRFLGKKCVHGLNYRMGIEELATQTGISINDAREAYMRYHTAFPEIQEGWDETIARVKRDKMLFTPKGRRMIFLEAITDDSLDSVIAFVPQSTIGDHVSETIYRCEDHPDWPINEARVWMNIHDAIIVLAKDQHLAICKEIMKEAAERPIPIRGKMVSIGTDFKVSYPDENGVHRWSQMKGY